MHFRSLLSLTLFASLFCTAPSEAQITAYSSNTSAYNYGFFKLSPDIAKKGFFSSDAEWFFSLGFNKTYYANSDIKIEQSALGNSFTVNSAQAHDEYLTPGLRDPDNYRVGRFIDDEKIWALDLSLDHDKYTVTENQTALVTGTYNCSTSNSGSCTGNQVLNANYFTYMLHNGLNHLMLDLTYRKPLIGSTNETSSLSFVGKLGTGLAIVHPFNVIDGHQNDVGQKALSNVLGFNSGWWRIVGSSTGLEAGVRYVISKPLYVELTDKSIFTYMRNIPVYSGTASQSILSNEIVLSIGYTFDGSKR
jgi:hypothetical protein